MIKKIEAYIRPERLAFIKEELIKIKITGMSITQVKGRGKQEGIKLQWRTGIYVVDLIDKIKVEIFLPAEKVDAAIEAIIKNAKTGSEGDGKIFVLPVEQAIRIRTGENGESCC